MSISSSPLHFTNNQPTSKKLTERYAGQKETPVVLVMHLDGRTA